MQQQSIDFGYVNWLSLISYYPLKCLVIDMSFRMIFINSVCHLIISSLKAKNLFLLLNNKLGHINSDKIKNQPDLK